MNMFYLYVVLIFIILFIVIILIILELENEFSFSSTLVLNSMFYLSTEICQVILSLYFSDKSYF